MVDSHTLPSLFGGNTHKITEETGKTWRPLQLFNLYRITLALLFILTYHLNGGALPLPLGMMLPKLFYLSCLVYLGFNLVAMVFIIKRRPRFTWQRNLHVLLDISFITILLYASGGVASGVGMLLIVTIAFASMLSAGRGALLFAALASILILGEETLASYTLIGARISFPQAGILGIALFTTAIIAHVLARRARESEELAVQRSLDLADMAQLTEYTIQQMRTGVLVVGNDGHVRLINGAAWKLLGSPMVPTHTQLGHYSQELQALLEKWRKGELNSHATLSSSQGNLELLLQFLPVGAEKSADTLIFLEDASIATQQAQQLKLASLGRLTASIAHEIRNPLGAVSHAADLLAEAPELVDADRRLTEIIKNHTQRINAIIEDVLRLGRRDKSYGELFELAPWLEEFCEEFIHGEHEQRDAIRCRCDEQGLQIYIDPAHLRQILTNLCHNGLRHAATASNPRVELIAGSLDEQWGILDIIDYGPGIPEEARNHIFEPFFTTESGGTGLGLYIARELAVCNNAKLQYKPDEDSRSRFRLHFARQRTTIE